MSVLLFESPARPLERITTHALSLACGVALALVFVPFPWSWLAPLPLAGLFWQVTRARDARGAFAAGFAGGLGFFAVHLLWLPVSFAALFGIVGALPMPFLALVLAAFWGITAGLTRRLAGRHTLVALAFAWVLLEWLRGLGPLAFTWGTLGYALLPTPVAQVADLGGVYLLSLLVTLSASGLAGLLHGHWEGLALCVSLLGAGAAYGLTRAAPPAPTLEVLLVQGSVDPVQRARARSASELELYGRLTREALTRGARPALIVWPEGAVPSAPTQPDTRAALERLGATPAVIGAPSFGADGVRNSAFGWDGRAVTGRFDKVKLVPFGEFFPGQGALDFVYGPIFAGMGLSGLRGTQPGTSYPALALGTIRAGAYICYESTFGAVSRALVRDGANLLVNISNDAWFGATLGAEQHFQMGRLRAIETRRWVARAGNDGITAVIDPSGRVTQRFERFAVAAFRARVGVSEAQTAYVRFGDWAVLLALLGACAVLVYSRWPSEREGW